MRCKTQLLAASIAALITAGLSLSAPALAADDTVHVGMSSTFNGAIGPLGQSSRNGIEMALANINANGGLLGKQIKLLSADDQAKPPVGVTNMRNFILNDKVVAMFGPVSSAVGSAMAGVAKQYKVPIFYIVSNDVDQTGQSFSKYVFQLVPSTYMEPRAVAAYVAERAKKDGWKTFYTISPDYSFGRTTVEQFLAGMKANGVEVDLKGQQWPALGASDFGQYISAANTSKADFIFIGQYGGDLVTLSKQASGAGLFDNAQAYAGYWMDALVALGKDAPAGVISSDRAKPFYEADTQAMKDFTEAYREKYKTLPSAWAIMGYSAVEAWAQGVKTAGSFDGDEVSDALSGKTVDSKLRGEFEIRACDHQAAVPEYMGVLSKEVHPEYGIRIMEEVVEIPADQIMMSCEAKEAMRK